TQDMNVITVNVIDPNSVATGVNTSAAENMDYSISPNPNNGSFNLNINHLPSGQPVKVAVYNLVGELVYSTESNAGSSSLSKDIQLNQASGVYFVKVNADNK